MMNCRGMGAMKGNKPKVMAKGKKVPGKIKGYFNGGLAAVDAALARGRASSEKGKAELAKLASLRQKMGVNPRGSGAKLPSGNLVTGGGKPAPTGASFSSGPIMPTPTMSAATPSGMPGNRMAQLRKGKKVPNKMMGGKMVPGYKAGKAVKRKMKGKSC